MDQHKAKILLNLETFPPLDVLEEILEEEVFHLRDYFLRNPVVAPLFKSRVRKLTQFEEIKKEFLRSNSDSEPPEDLKLNSAKNFEELFTQLEKCLAQLRGEMSRGLSPKTIATLAEQMVKVQMEYELLYIKVFLKKHSEPTSKVSVKAAEHISTGKALHLTKEGNSKELTEMLEKEYLRIMQLHKVLN